VAHRTYIDVTGMKAWIQKEIDEKKKMQYGHEYRERFHEDTGAT
jgi:hypothetical protein